MDLETKLAHLVGVGPTLSSRLEKLGLITISDLIHHYPFRYDDFSQITQTTQLKDGEVVTLKGEIWSIANTYTRSRKVITKAIFNDGNGSIELVWFNQSYLTKSLPSGTNLQISGKVKNYKGRVSIMAPRWERIATNSKLSPIALHTGRLVPVYPETYGLTSTWFRNKLSQLLPRVLDQIIDPIPEDLRSDMYDLKKALSQIHFPDNLENAEAAKNRLSFDELFFLQLESQYQRARWQDKTITQSWEVPQKKLDQFVENLPFNLTSAQERVVQEIISDLKKEHPMNRLVQGEVGSGKTVVAAVIIYLAYINKLASVLMAPTEILAFQHHQTLSRLLEPLGIKVGLYTGSRKTVDQEHKVIVGTHAVLSDKLDYSDLGLVIIDEQQRFGVEQRTLLRAKAKVPHFLTMTATPIPRTVALTLYGDLDLSVIDELPKDRLPIKTFYVPSQKRDDSYKFIADLVKKGQQAYIITPLIEESETLTSVRAAKAEFERLGNVVFPDLKVGLLHGRLNPKDKEKVINDFKDRHLDILISTSVVEVGVDNPNATVMVIEGAERFGLAQLHQLRGRVGRGVLQSYCFLFTENEDQITISRLKNLEKISNGLKLAELDLQIRGSGQVFGIKQSGFTDLKIASLLDLELIEKTKQSAQRILNQDPDLDKHPLLKGKLLQDMAVMPD